MTARGADAGLVSMDGDLLTTSRHIACQFFAGATMWCTAPELPSQAQRLAAEFSNPVAAGKRGLRAVAVDGEDLVITLRAVSSSGDVLVAIAGAEDGAVRAALRRAPAWGMRTIWIGRGHRPPAGAADHVLWLEEGLSSAPSDDCVALIGHRLWELTHECLDHPSQVDSRVAEGEAVCKDEVCVTCSDEGRLAEVITAGPGHDARVRTATGIELIDTTLIGTPRPDDLLLVHAGFAVTLIEA